MTLNYDVGGSGGSDFKPVPAGTHFAVCTGVFDIGLQPGSVAFPKPKNILMLRFEVPEERATKDDGSDGGPGVIYERFNATMNEKGRLRGALQAWYGKGFTDDEAKRIDISKVAGRPATITVTHNNSGGKTYANIENIGPLPKGVNAPQPEGDIVVYHQGKKDQFDKVPKFLQEKIRNPAKPLTEDDLDELRAAEHAANSTDDVPWD